MKLLYATFGAMFVIAPCLGAILNNGNAYLIAGFGLTLLGGGGVGWLLCECANRADVATLPESPKGAESRRHSQHKRIADARSIPMSRPVRGGLAA
jgi:hypothetical protein